MTGGDEEAFERSIMGEPVQAVQDPTPTPTPVADPTPSPEPEPDPIPDAPAADFDPNAIDYDWQAKPEPEPKELTADAEKVISERFSQYGFNSGADVEAFVREAKSGFEQRYAAMKAELDTAKSAQMSFANDYQKKLYEFAKNYDGSNGSALADYERLTSLDLGNMTQKDRLREAYIFDNRDLGAAKAAKMFEFEFEEKYDTSSLDPELDAKAIEKKNLLLERDSHNASKKLVEAINTFRPEAPKQERAVENTAVTESVKNSLATVEAELRDFGVLDVRLDQNNTYKMGLGKEEAAKIVELVKGHFSNPANYDDGGKEVNGMTPSALADMLVFIRNKEQIIEAACKRAVHLSEMRKIKERQPAPSRPLAPGVNGARPVPKSDEEAFEQSLQ